MDKKEMSRQFFSAYHRMPEFREILYTEMTGYLKIWKKVTRKERIQLIMKYPGERIMKKGIYKKRDKNGKSDIVPVMNKIEMIPYSEVSQAEQRAKNLKQWHIDRKIQIPKNVQNILDKYNL